MRVPALFAVLLAGLSAGLCAADEPPPPPALAPVPPPLLLNPQWGRVSRYAAWQDYGVDRFGYWRPRVVYTPGEGYFYYYNGRPFPYASTHPLEFMPYANDE